MSIKRLFYKISSFCVHDVFAVVWLGVCKYSACAVILFDMQSFISSCSVWVCNPEFGHFVVESGAIFSRVRLVCNANKASFQVSRVGLVCQRRLACIANKPCFRRKTAFCGQKTLCDYCTIEFVILQHGDSQILVSARLVLRNCFAFAGFLRVNALWGVWKCKYSASRCPVCNVGRRMWKRHVCI